jgi:hypothetical protein
MEVIDMSRAEKRAYLMAIRVRYSRSTRSEKGKKHTSAQTPMQHLFDHPELEEAAKTCAQPTDRTQSL